LIKLDWLWAKRESNLEMEYGEMYSNPKKDAEKVFPEWFTAIALYQS
jgi:hypothetical protein